MFRKINATAYLLGTWLFSMFLCAHFLQTLPDDTLRDQIHTVLILLTYGVMYQAPAILSYWLLRRFRALAICVAIVFSVLGHLFVFADSRIYDLFAFHINGFVWNLITSPGGLASLGADQTNLLLLMKYVAVLLAVHAVSLLMSFKLSRVHIPVGRLVLLFLLATLSERTIYAYSKAELYGPVLDRGDAMPLYQPMSMNTLLSRMGMVVKKASHVKLDQHEGQLDYPKHPLALSQNSKPLNIVMLVAESMRWDLLTAEIMPNMEAFSRKAWKFTSHYSGGNGTRQGLFALFYGIPGNYWDIFLRIGRGPVLFDVLNDYHYQYFVYTSAKFSYPELDQTVFRQIPKEQLIENNVGEAWQRDESNSTALITAIQNRDRSRPFFGFLFYESTHARYSFPETAIVRKDYLPSVDYAGLSREELAPQVKGLKARYDNAAYGIDRQLQRVVHSLEESGDLDNTLVIVTGDHGEEFMERGRWGHNSSFNDWQVRVPMVVWLPGNVPRVVTERTSHMDIAPTILSRLGVKNPVRDYSLGVDLSSPAAQRNIVVASWSDIGLINDYGKLVIPFKSTTQHQNLATGLDDYPVDGSSLTSKMQPLVLQALADARFYTKRSSQ